MKINYNDVPEQYLEEAAELNINSEKQLERVKQETLKEKTQMEVEQMREEFKRAMLNKAIFNSLKPYKDK